MLLELKNVSKVYQMNQHQVHALKNISLKIKKGEFVAIIGPSGSGKSTLMHIMGCLDTPTSGEVIFEGQDICKLDEAALAKIRSQKVGFVFQTYNLLARTSALANVMLPLVYSDINNPRKEKEKAAKILAVVGLEERLAHSAGQLSGGQQQRVAIARALINNPSIVFADEPTGNLDSKSGKEILKLLQKINKKGNTIVLVTHDQEIAKFAKRTIKVKDGEIVK